MHLFSFAMAATFCAAALLGQPAGAQDRAFAFSLTGGVSFVPSYFGSGSHGIAPSGSFNFTG